MYLRFNKTTEFLKFAISSRVDWVIREEVHKMLTLGQLAGSGRWGDDLTWFFVEHLTSTLWSTLDHIYNNALNYAINVY